MDYREANFRKKFSDAARHLGVKPNQVVSLKLRENVGSYSEYHRLLQSLEQEIGLHYSEVHGDFMGRGYILADCKDKIILVEHETGLEILYIAGSVASLISLVAMVLQYWRGLRGPHHPIHQSDAPVEIRRLDRDGRLSENNAARLPDFLAAPVNLNTTVAALLEDELKQIGDELKTLTARLERLERQPALKAKKHRSSKADKKKR